MSVSSARAESLKWAFGTADASAARHKPSDRNDGSAFGARRHECGRSRLLLHNDSAVLALPACSDGFDNVDGGPECGVYIQMRGIEQVCIFRAFEGGCLPRRITLVPAPDVGQHVRLLDRHPDGLQLQRPPAGPHLGGRGHEYLNVSVREDDGPDIAAIEHRAGRLAPELPLKIEQRRPYLGDRRHHRGGLADRMAFQHLFVEGRWIERPRGASCTGHVIERLAGVEHRLRHRAVDQAGVEVPEAEMARQPFPQRPLARRRRSIDGNNHGDLADRIFSTASRTSAGAVGSSSTTPRCLRPITRSSLELSKSSAQSAWLKHQGSWLSERVHRSRTLMAGTL